MQPTGSLHVSGFPPGTSRDKIGELCGRAGPVRSVAMKRDYCFVNLASAEVAARARTELTGNTELGGRPLVINFAKETKETKDPKEGNEDSLTAGGATGAGQGADDEAANIEFGGRGSSSEGAAVKVDGSETAVVDDDDTQEGDNGGSAFPSDDESALNFE